MPCPALKPSSLRSWGRAIFYKITVPSFLKDVGGYPLGRTIFYAYEKQRLWAQRKVEIREKSLYTQSWKAGGGRTVRQSGQVRKEAAATKCAGSLSSLPLIFPAGHKGDMPLFGFRKENHGH